MTITRPNSVTAMPSTCYFELLAPELIQLIFLYCIDKRDEHFIEYRVDAPPLVLLAVCKRWYHLAFQTPGLFDSISLRRRVQAPDGFYFNLDSWVLRSFIELPRSRYKLRPLSIQLCYGDIRKYGNRLMWSNLLRMVRAMIEMTENLERLYLRFPDDCMEKLLMKVCSEAGNPIRHARLRSLTLHSTREEFIQRRYLSWWHSQEPDAMPAYYHKLDTSHLPALEELGLHYPGPLTLDPLCITVRKLHASLFKWEQLEQYLESCPNVEDLIIELREPLQEQDWDTEGLNPAIHFKKIRRLEIRSALKGWVCSNKLAKLFPAVRMPNLKIMRLRRLPQCDKDEPPFLHHSGLIMNYLSRLEVLETIDFLPERRSEWNLWTMFAKAHNLRRLVYREEEIDTPPEYLARLISALTFSGTETCAPKLEVLELNSKHLPQGRLEIIRDLVLLISSRRHPSFYVNTSSKRRSRTAPILPCLLRKVLLPLGCSDVVRQADTLGACQGVEFDCIPTLEKLELETDLDEEGPPRDLSRYWEPPHWLRSEEVESPVDGHTSGSVQPEPIPTGVSTSSSALQPMDPILEVEQMLTQNMEDENVGGATSNSQANVGLDRLDSLAEVELML